MDDTLFGWLTTLYPVWGRIDADLVHTAATGGLAWLAETGCTTTTDHHYVFPRDGGDVLHGGNRCGATGRAAVPPDPRVDGPGAEQGRPAAGQRGGGHRRDPGGHRGGDRHPPRPVVRLDAADRRRALLAVLGDRRSAQADRGSGPAQGRADAHPPVRDAGRGGLLPGAFRLLPGRVRGVPGLARPRCLARPCGAPVRRVDRLAGRHRHLGGALPDLQRQAGRRASAASRDLRDAGVAVGLGVDGAASNEACSLLEEVRHALLFARARAARRR